MKKKILLTVLFWVLCSVALAAEPSVTLPVTASVKPGRLLKLTATSDQKTVKWINLNDGADLISSESGRWAIFSAPSPGVFKVGAYTAAGDVPSEVAICNVTVEGPTPPPPPPPPPDDPLFKFLQGAYDGETSLNKSAQLSWLASVYATADTAINSSKVVTYADLFGVLSQAVSVNLKKDDLASVRKILEGELNKTFGTDFTKPVDKALALKTFARIASLLKGVKV